tara:strand:+ start:805 stop:1182 length:378 start_codon:yes stop_codon:yes gene_type:complete
MEEETRGRKDLIEQGVVRQKLALSFLADEVFTNRRMLMEVTGIITHKGIRHFIRRLEKMDLIKNIEIPSIEEEGKIYDLVGITTHGMALAGKVNRRGVEISKIKHSQLLHKFLCQRVHLNAIGKG